MTMTFCVIDDEREICDLFRLIFESRGHRCVIAHNGADGLEAVRAHRPAAVFLDVQMPRMNGIEVLAAIRADKAISATPVMLMTALTQETNMPPRDWAKSTGADAFLPKPFELDDLLAQVQQITGLET
jgi:CheY-like chemotaxis protein